MKCQILFIGKNKKNISKCRLLKILPRVLSVNAYVSSKDLGIHAVSSRTFPIRSSNKWIKGNLKVMDLVTH